MGGTGIGRRGPELWSSHRGEAGCLPASPKQRRGRDASAMGPFRAMTPERCLMPLFCSVCFALPVCLLHVRNYVLKPLDTLGRPFYSSNKRTGNRYRRRTAVGNLVIAIAVVICTAYLLWQFWERDLLDDR